MIFFHEEIRIEGSVNMQRECTAKSRLIQAFVYGGKIAVSIYTVAATIIRPSPRPVGGPALETKGIFSPELVLNRVLLVTIKKSDENYIR